MKLDEIAKAYKALYESSASQQLYEEILEEGRIDFLKQKFPNVNTSHDPYALHKDPHAVIDFLANNVDPSKNKVHTQWLVNQYHRGGFRQEDAGRVRDALVNFDQHKSKLPVEQRDIGRYGRVSDLENAVAPHIGTANTKAERIMGQGEMPGLTKKYEDENIKIHHLHDKATSCKVFGGETKWCTASKDEDRNMFDHYNSEGKLHVITRKKDGAVFQYHVNSNQFMDKNDDPISSKDWDSIKDSVHKAWDQDKSLLE